MIGALLIRCFLPSFWFCRPWNFWKTLVMDRDRTSVSQADWDLNRALEDVQRTGVWWEQLSRDEKTFYRYAYLFHTLLMTSLFIWLPWRKILSNETDGKCYIGGRSLDFGRTRFSWGWNAYSQPCYFMKIGWVITMALLLLMMCSSKDVLLRVLAIEGAFSYLFCHSNDKLKLASFSSIFLALFSSICL